MIRDNFLSTEECERAIKHIDNNIEKDNFTWGNLHKCQNVVTEDKKLLDKIWKVVNLSNTLTFKFDIENIQQSFGKKYPLKKRHTDSPTLHSDFAAGGDNVVNTRTKISSVIFLNDDYEGGELQIWNDVVESKQGRIVIFPAFAAHKVLEYYKKERYTMITFIEGTPFK